jgi:acyl-CoA thioester hydrolase
MFTHSTKIRVRYGETDQMGFVYYGNYSLYYEVGRVEAIRSLGLSYKSLEEQGIGMPVVKLESRYLLPAVYDDLLVVETEIRMMPDRFIVFDVRIFNEEEVLLNLGKVTLCFWDNRLNRRMRTPALIIEKLQPYFED